MITRRELLLGALGLGGVAALGLSLGVPLTAWAEGAVPTLKDRYFVFVYFPGGWDTMLSVDPKDPDRFNEDRLAETGILPAYERLDGLVGDPLRESAVSGMVFGPYIGDLIRHAPRMTVVRGMAMDSVAHLVGQRNALTGRVPAGTSVRGSSLSTFMAALLADGEPIPNLTGAMESFNLGHPLWASGLSVQDIDTLQVALASPNGGVGPAERDAIDRFFAAERLRTTSSFERMALANRAAGRTLVTEELASLFDVDARTPEMIRLRERFGLDAGASGPGARNALMAAQALTQGVSRCVTMRACSGLDTHNSAWEREQGPRQQSGFDAVAALVDHLSETPFGDGTSWFDHTTIVLQSEFSRTPAINSSGGRDHHITNSTVLLGGGIRRGAVVGATSDYKNGAQAIDPRTGQVDPGGVFVHNHHIARTLFESIGVTDDIADLRCDPIPALLA